ncbi:MAG: HAMP domain-containing histidine kinase [Actinobacteria bacterium]|nr:HAMP domain-containing histidine kinase [Actinomycetota bacterium]
MTDQVSFAELISKIAHELRSPLTSVKGFSSTLVSRWDRFTDEQRRELVGVIHSDAERMGRIVSEVLDLARLESNRLELRQVSAELAPIGQKALEDRAALEGADRVELQVPEGVKAWVDPDRFLHVASNLVENAIKFSDDGPIVVSARTEGDDTIFEVTDEGVGITSDRIEGIFSGPGPTGQKSTPSGTGLGLYLSRRLIEAHKGSIEVASEAGRGSRFTVRVPATGREG